MTPVDFTILWSLDKFGPQGPRELAATVQLEQLRQPWQTILARLRILRGDGFVRRKGGGWELTTRGRSKVRV